MTARSASYVADMIVSFIALDLSRHIHGLFAILPALAESWTVGYLLVPGVRTSARRPQNETTVVATVAA